MRKNHNVRGQKAELLFLQDKQEIGTRKQKHESEESIPLVSSSGLAFDERDHMESSEKEDEEEEFPAEAENDFENKSNGTVKDSKDSEHPCLICPFIARGKLLTLERHIQKDHTRGNLLYCPSCRFVAQFSNSGKLKIIRHIQDSHRNTKVIKTEPMVNTSAIVVKKEFSIKNEKISKNESKEEQTTIDQMNFGCDRCNYETNDKKDYKAHYKTVHKIAEMAYPCRFCMFKSSIIRMAIHVKAVHLKIREFICKWCNYEFSRKSNLKRHLARAHSEEEAQEMKTTNQEGKVAIKETYNSQPINDMLIVSYENEEMSAEDEVSNTFATISPLFENNVEINPDKAEMEDGFSLEKIPNQCISENIVGSFVDINDSGNMDSEREFDITEGPIKLISCTRCNYQTTRKYYMSRHMSNAHNPVQCNICPYIAEQGQEDLRDHSISTHKRGGVWFCPEGDYEALHGKEGKEKVVRHVREVHHKMKKYMCTECDYRSARNERLIKHIVDAHSTVPKTVSPENPIAPIVIRPEFKDGFDNERNKDEDDFFWPADEGKSASFQGDRPFTSSINKPNSSDNDFISETENEETQFVVVKEKMVECPDCSFKAASKHIVTHMETYHRNVMGCIKCKYASMDKTRFKLHLELDHLEKRGKGILYYSIILVSKSS